MTDVSHNIPRLPGADTPLDYDGANAIEYNLYALIRAWPVFEDQQVKPFVGSYGYLQLDENASPSEGIEVTFMQRLPRLMVFLSGEGLESLSWRGNGWTAEKGVLVYTLSDPSESNANSALRNLWFSATGDVDATVILAGENLEWESDGLRLYGIGWTKILFRSKATWGLVKAKKLTWGGAKPLTWGEAAQLRKDG